MTLRQVSIALKYIDVRLHNDFVLKASIHGHKIPLKNAHRKRNNAVQSEFNKDEEKALDEAMRRAMERVSAMKKG